MIWSIIQAVHVSLEEYKNMQTGHKNHVWVGKANFSAETCQDSLF